MKNEIIKSKDHKKTGPGPQNQENDATKTGWSGPLFCQHLLFKSTKKELILGRL